MKNKITDLQEFIEKAFSAFKEENSNVDNFSLITEKKISKGECIYLYDLPQNKLLYQKGFLSCLGYQDDVISFEFLFNNIHPDDIEIVQNITKKAMQYSIDHPKNSKKNQLFITYRHKTSEGEYIRVLNQTTIFKVNKKGIIQTLFIKLTDISFIESADIVSWSFKASGLNEKKFKKDIYKHVSNTFTQRELELITEIVKGSTNHQIAEKFNISIHTVATHRKNILQKAGCHNFIELEIYCKGKGII